MVLKELNQKKEKFAELEKANRNADHKQLSTQIKNLESDEKKTIDRLNDILNENKKLMN